MFFGQSVFGDATPVPSSASTPIDVESGGSVPINTGEASALSIAQHRAWRETIGRTGRLAPGSVVGVDPTKVIDERVPMQIPIRTTDPQQLAVRPLRPGEPGPGTHPETARQMAYQQFLRLKHPGVFHTPPRVGQQRYADGSFGPPALGAGPDGLGRYR